MTQNEIPDEVKKFIHKYIESLAQLEVLLFFYNNKAGSYTTDMAATELRTSTEAVNLSLTELTSYGFLILENTDKKTYEYKMGNNEEPCIRQVETAYQNYRHTLITIIFSRPSESIQSFSDEFKFKKDNN